jgi:hypothetical protein
LSAQASPILTHDGHHYFYYECNKDAHIRNDDSTVRLARLVQDRLIGRVVEQPKKKAVLTTRSFEWPTQQLKVNAKNGASKQGHMLVEIIASSPGGKPTGTVLAHAMLNVDPDQLLSEPTWVCNGECRFSGKRAHLRFTWGEDLLTLFGFEF